MENRENKTNNEELVNDIKKALDEAMDLIELETISRQTERQIVVNTEALKATFAGSDVDLSSIAPKYISKLVAVLTRKAGIKDNDAIIKEFKEVSLLVIKEIEAERFMKNLLKEED